MIMVSHSVLSLPQDSSTYPSLPPPPPANHGSFHSLYSFVFSRMSRNWNHTVYLQIGLFNLVMCISVPFNSFHSLRAYFFLALDSLLSGWITSIYPLTYWRTTELSPSLGTYILLFFAHLSPPLPQHSKDRDCTYLLTLISQCLELWLHKMGTQ